MHDIQLYEFLKIHLILLSFIFILNDNCLKNSLKSKIVHTNHKISDTNLIQKKNVHNQTFHKLPLPQQKQKLTDLQWEKITRFVFLNEVYRVLKLDM